LPHAIGVAVGFPDEHGIYLSKSDWAQMAQFVQGLRDWIEAAQPCLTRKP
jgi:hypothetical protein